MNKKVLTLCAAMLLSGSSLVYAGDYTNNGISGTNWQVELKQFTDKPVKMSGDGLTMTVLDDVTYDDQRKFLLIDRDNFVLDGQGKTWNGRIVITGENVTIKKLNINYKNVMQSPNAGEDGTVIENKSAITVFASKVNLEDNVITVSSSNPNDAHVANGITICSLSDTPEFNLTGNTIKNANEIAKGDDTWPVSPAFGIEIIGGIPTGTDNGYTYFSGTNSQSKEIKDFSKSKFLDNTILNSAVDYAYVKATGKISSTNPNTDEFGVIKVTPNETNAAAIAKAVTNAAEKATVRFNGSAEELLHILTSEKVNLKDKDLAVECDGVNLLFGEATAPNNTNPSQNVELNADGTIKPILLADKATKFESGRYYLLQNTKNQIMANHWDLELYSQVTDKADYLWRLDEIISTDNSTAYATLKNKNGVFFCGGGSAANTKVAVKLKKENNTWVIDYSNGHVYFSLVTNLGQQTADNSSKDITVVEAPANTLLSMSQLVKYLGASFDMQLSFDNKSLENDPLTGTLTPTTKWANGSSIVSADDNHYALKNAEGEYIVVKLGEQYAVGAGQTYGYEVTTMTDYELRTALSSDKAREYAYKFSIYAYDDFTLGDQLAARVQVENNWSDQYVLGALTLKDKKNYLAAEAGTKNVYQYNIAVRLGHFNTVDVEKLLGTTPAFFTVTNKNINKKHDNYGKVLGIDNSGNVNYVKATDALLGYPETQFAVTYNAGENKLYFTNREKPTVWYWYDAGQMYNVPGKENVYAINGDTIEIKAHTDYTPADGFKRYNFAELEDQDYYVGVYNSVLDAGMWLTENHTNSHKVGLEGKQENATEWGLQAIMRYKEDIDGKLVELTPDTVVIKSNLGFYKNGQYTTTDAQKVEVALKFPAYALKNQENNEYLGYYDSKYHNVDYYTTGDASEKIGYTRIGDAEIFALKEAGNGKYELVIVNAGRGIENGNYVLGMNPLYGATISGRIYGGDSENVAQGKGMLNKENNMYAQNENNIFVIEEKAAPEYKKITMGDTISIFRNEDAQDVLFEKGEFLGTATSEQFKDANPALYVDTAYVNRPYNNRWEYLLAVNAKHWESKDDCGVEGHPKHEADTTTGRFLVNLMDSAYVYHANNIHNNKFINEEDGETFAKLGFVNGYHTHDTLYLQRPNGTYDKIAMVRKDASHTIAKFAFRYVDNDSESFVIETGVKAWNGGEATDVVRRGFLKWMNGTIVVVDDIKNAEVFNMNTDETRTPTANENIAAGNVVVAGVNGAVVVKGAEGKNVIVSTILGKVVANEVVSSDNATIAAPAGIVVVSVDGESFKVVVK